MLVNLVIVVAESLYTDKPSENCCSKYAAYGSLSHYPAAKSPAVMSSNPFPVNEVLKELILYLLSNKNSYESNWNPKIFLSNVWF